MAQSKVVVFGIDGATYSIIRPLIEQGRLPHLAAMIRNGSSGELLSTIPPITAPAWVSFMTGVNPGRHGVFHFLTDSHRDYDEGLVMGSGHIRSKTLWQTLTDEGKKVIAVGVPFTFPPTPVNGAMVCGWDDRFVSMFGTYPPDLHPKISEILDFKETMSGSKLLASFGRDSKAELLRTIVSLADHFTVKVKEVTHFLMKQYPDWDFLMVYFYATDALQHHLWAFMDPAHPAHDSALAVEFGGAIQRCYERVDAVVGELMAEFDDSTYVVAMSDHGFGSLYKLFAVNRWLLDMGLLALKPGWFSQRRFEMTKPTLGRVCERLGVGAVKRLLPSFLRGCPIPIPRWTLRSVTERIDWSRTLAYATAFGINVNLHGREPQGAVAPGEEFENVVRRLVTSLQELRDPATGEQVVDRVIRKEDLYHGPHVGEANDVFFTVKNMAYIHSKDLDAPALFLPIQVSNMGTGSHRFEGIYVVSGPGVTSGSTIQGARIIDVMPSILYWLGLPVREGLDGRVLVESMEPDFLNRQPVRYAADTHAEPVAAAAQHVSQEDEELIKHQLKSLGYMG